MKVDGYKRGHRTMDYLRKADVSSNNYYIEWILLLLWWNRDTFWRTCILSHLSSINLWMWTSSLFGQKAITALENEILTSVLTDKRQTVHVYPQKEFEKISFHKRITLFEVMQQNTAERVKTNCMHVIQR